jgi:predicted nucleotidyltransferase
MLDLPDRIKGKLIKVLSEEKNVKQAILFGSRARGDARINSDIDLALLGSHIPLSINTKLRDAAGLYTLDIVRIDGLDNGSLMESIDRDGVVIYSCEETPALAQ